MALKALDEIKQMMDAGETIQAEVALKELLEKEPDSLHAKILYGTCCLLNDPYCPERFDLHDELEPEAKRRIAEGDSDLERIWNEYHECVMTPITTYPLSMESVVLAILITAAVVAALCYFTRLSFFVCSDSSCRQYEVLRSSSLTSGVRKCENA